MSFDGFGPSLCCWEDRCGVQSRISSEYPCWVQCVGLDRYGFAAAQSSEACFHRCGRGGREYLTLPGWLACSQVAEMTGKKEDTSTSCGGCPAYITSIDHSGFLGVSILCIVRFYFDTSSNSFRSLTASYTVPLV